MFLAVLVGNDGSDLSRTREGGKIKNKKVFVDQGEGERVRTEQRSNNRAERTNMRRSPDVLYPGNIGQHFFNSDYAAWL